MRGWQTIRLYIGSTAEPVVVTIPGLNGMKQGYIIDIARNPSGASYSGIPTSWEVNIVGQFIRDTDTDVLTLHTYNASAQAYGIWAHTIEVDYL